MERKKQKKQWGGETAIDTSETGYHEVLHTYPLELDTLQLQTQWNLHGDPRFSKKMTYTSYSLRLDFPINIGIPSALHSIC